MTRSRSHSIAIDLDQSRASVASTCHEFSQEKTEKLVNLRGRHKLHAISVQNPSGNGVYCAGNATESDKVFPPLLPLGCLLPSYSLPPLPIISLYNSAATYCSNSFLNTHTHVFINQHAALIDSDRCRCGKCCSCTLHNPQSTLHSQSQSQLVLVRSEYA